MNNSKQINQIRIIIIGIAFVIIATASLAQAMYDEKTAPATDNEINVHSIYIRPEKTRTENGEEVHYEAKTIERLYSKNGSVTINHKAGISSGSKDMCIDDNISFGYDPSFTFVAGNGAWDTPRGKWVNNINQNRKGEAYSSTYWQKIDDPGSGSRSGKIAWSAVKPLAWNGSGSNTGKVRMTSDNINIVSCTGMQCVARSNGIATVTAHFPPVTTRMWTYVTFSEMDPDWISEHFSHPDSVNNRFPDRMFCPTVRKPSNDNTNYCTNRLILPAKTVSWTVNVGVATRCESCGDGAVNGTPIEACDTSWSGNTYSIDDCTAGYGSMCQYCVSPGRLGECTLVDKPGPFCGDGIKNGSEDCDHGTTGVPRNGFPCDAPYDGTCPYCSNTCTNAIATGPYCGDGIKNGSEECDGENYCDENCNIQSSCNNTFTNSNERPTESTSGLCGMHSSLVLGSIIMNGDYRWEWQCQHDSLPAVTCVADNCLSGSPEFQVQSPVYFDSVSNVSVYCNGVSDFCCTVGSPHDVTVCSGASDQIGPIDATNRSFFVECSYVDDPNDRSREYDIGLATMCVSRACNEQGTCQTTPMQANLPNDPQCASTCNSNADCSSGRMIETRP